MYQLPFDDFFVSNAKFRYVACANIKDYPRCERYDKKGMCSPRYLEKGKYGKYMKINCKETCGICIANSGNIELLLTYNNLINF